MKVDTIKLQFTAINNGNNNKRKGKVIKRDRKIFVIKMRKKNAHFSDEKL